MLNWINKWARYLKTILPGIIIAEDPWDMMESELRQEMAKFWPRRFKVNPDYGCLLDQPLRKWGYDYYPVNRARQESYWLRNDRHAQGINSHPYQAGELSEEFTIPENLILIWEGQRDIEVYLDEMERCHGTRGE